METRTINPQELVQACAGRLHDGKAAQIVGILQGLLGTDRGTTEREIAGRRLLERFPGLQELDRRAILEYLYPDAKGKPKAAKTESTGPEEAGKGV